LQQHEESQNFEYTYSNVYTKLRIYGKKQSDCTLQMPPDDSIKKGILQVTIDCAKKQTPNIVKSKSSLGSNLVS
jgi:hypothetical protein